MEQKCIIPTAGPQVMEDDNARGVENVLGRVVVDEEGVLRSWLAPVGYPLQWGDALAQSRLEDLEELLYSAMTTGRPFSLSSSSHASWLRTR